MKDWTQTITLAGLMVALAGLLISIMVTQHNAIGQRIETLDSRVYEMNERLTVVEQGMMHIEFRLANMESIMLEPGR